MTIRPEAIRAIDAHGWPGNVRELENCVKRAVIMADAAALNAHDFGLAPVEAADGVLTLREVREKAEKEALVRALGQVNGNMSRAAELLGISRPTLYDLIERFGMK
jgi:two-component system NtrC family response regulator